MDTAPGYAYNDFTWQPDPPHQPLYLAKVLAELGADPSIESVLDAGCGDGNFSESLFENGFSVCGIDLSSSGIQIAQGRNIGQFHLASLYEPLLASFPALDHVDAIVCVEVIEHLYSPRSFVSGAYDALRPGGRLIVTTPYWGYWKNIALAVAGRTDRNLTALWDGGHIKHWSRRTLTTLLEEKGFEVVGFRGAGRLPYLWNGMVLTARKA